MKNKVLIPLILTTILCGCSFNNNNDNFVWVEREYGIENYIGIDYDEFMKKCENKEDFILYIYSPTCLACKDFAPILNRYISTNDVRIYAIQTKYVGPGISYAHTPTIQLFNDGELQDSIDSIKDEKVFSSYENLESYFNANLKIMKTTFITSEEDLFNIINNNENAIIYYFYDGCSDCIYFSEHYLNDYLKSDGCNEFFMFSVKERFENRESSSDPYWVEFTSDIMISSTSKLGYKNGVVPTIAKYNKGEIVDLKVIFNDEVETILDDNGELTAVKVTSSYYEDCPFINEVFYGTEDKTARNVYKERTLDFYKSKFLEIFAK